MSLFMPYPRTPEYSKNWTNARPSATIGTTVTAAGSSHALGNFATLFTSTFHDTYWVRITLTGSATNNTQTDQLMNIYVGADGAEQIIIPNLLTGAATNLVGNGQPMRCYEFPLYIPRGSQIKAKLQALIASDTVVVMMELWGGGEQNGWAGVGVECVGAVTASSQGTSVTPGGASEGTFTDIGTTVREWKYILPMCQGILTDTALSNPLVAVDVGVGGAVYQELEEFWFHLNATEASAPAMGGRGRFALIPSGTALQLRSQASSATIEPSDFCIYGVY